MNIVYNHIYGPLRNQDFTSLEQLDAATLILENSIYMEQNYKSCFGMLMLVKKYGAARLEVACDRALKGPRVNYTMIKNILVRGLDMQINMPDTPPIPSHGNIRGKENYI